MVDIYKFLDDNNISYEKYEHPAVFTCEEAEKHVPQGLGADTKNLFLRNRKGDQHYLVSVPYKKSVDLKKLTELLGESKLSFGSPERLMTHLGIEPGAVSILGLINDQDHNVKFYIDKAIIEHDSVMCHPLVNTATLNIPTEDLKRFLELTGHGFTSIDVPSR